MTEQPALLGIDLGSSSIKVAIVHEQSGHVLAQAASPATELPILSPRPGWAEQYPEVWWEHTVHAVRAALAQAPGANIKAIGIAYQMHGLVLLDRQQAVVRPAIIWCDSRAADIGERAFREMGAQHCLTHYLNSPANFTAAKLKWVQQHEPNAFARADKMLLPGDYLAYRLTNEICTTASGLSEAVLWNFAANGIATDLLAHLQLSPDLLPALTNTFAQQGLLSKAAAHALGLPAGIPITYRAGDQPNNALSLNVLQPGQVAATAGTSGVIYAVSQWPMPDEQQRINTFLHVNHTAASPRLGALMCLNGAGIFYRWLRGHFLSGMAYEEMNALAGHAPPGADGLLAMPFGNGAERLLNNRLPGAALLNLDFNRHTGAHVVRAAQEGIAFSLRYGFDVLQSLGLAKSQIKAGKANLFNSQLFCEIFATLTQSELQLFHTDGAVGAARGAGIGAGSYTSPSEALKSLQPYQTVAPKNDWHNHYEERYQLWKQSLEHILQRC